MERFIDRFYLHLLSHKDLIRSNCKEKNIEISPTEDKSSMLSELFNMVSQLEQSLAEIKLDINEIENQTNEE